MAPFLRKLWTGEEGQDIAEHPTMPAVILVLVVGVRVSFVARIIESGPPEQEASWESLEDSAEFVAQHSAFRELLFHYGHMYCLHFRDFCDDNRVRPVALKHDSVHSHIFAHKGHQLLRLTVIRHFVRDRQIQVAILGQDSERRTGL